MGALPTVPECESMAIIVGNMAACRHGAGTVAERLHLETIATRQREVTGHRMSF